MSKKQYWLIFAGMDMAGATAGDHASVFYGTEEEANKQAYQESIEMVQDNEGMHGMPIFTDSPEDYEEDVDCLPYDCIEDYLDYYVKPITQELLDNYGLDEDLLDLIKRVKDDPKQVYKSLGLYYGAN